MNKTRILNLADHLESSKVVNAFSMSCYSREDVIYNNPCNSAGCIAGHTYFLFVNGEINLNEVNPNEIHSKAKEALGITHAQASDLFTPCTGAVDEDRKHAHWLSNRRELSYISRFRAAKVLRHMVETGEIDWARFPNEVDGE